MQEYTEVVLFLVASLLAVFSGMLVSRGIAKPERKVFCFGFAVVNGLISIGMYIVYATSAITHNVKF